jgi:hypothetical protein
LQRDGYKKVVLIMVAYRVFKQQNMEDESVTSPLANEKGNKRRIVDTMGKFVSLVYVSSSRLVLKFVPSSNSSISQSLNLFLLLIKFSD